MAATYMLAAGRVTPAGTSVSVDMRLAELLQWQQEERRTLPLFADPYRACIIIWLENHGYYVDLITGAVEQLEPLQAYPYRTSINYQAELEELRDGMAEEEYLRSWH
jgi:hypothetical protein